jgi:hypothetical protein
VTRKQLDRAILKLFNMEAPVVRHLLPVNLYDYGHALWSKTKQGRRELAKRRKGDR